LIDTRRVWCNSQIIPYRLNTHNYTLQQLLQNRTIQTKLDALDNALETTRKPKIRAAGCIFSFLFNTNPVPMVCNTVLMAVIVKALGFTGLATLGALASAAALGSVFAMPLAILWGLYAPTNTSLNPLRWDIKIALLNLVVAAGISLLGLAIGSLILGTTMSPSLFIGLAVSSSIGIFWMMTGIGVAKSVAKSKIDFETRQCNALVDKLNDTDIMCIKSQINREIEHLNHKMMTQNNQSISRSPGDRPNR
jgi:hypothetical protein